MTKFQLAQARAMRQTILAMHRFQDAWKSIEAFDQQLHILEAKVERIREIAGEQEADRRGFTADKNRLSDELVAAITTVNGPLTAWAAIEKLETLRQEMDMSVSQLERVGAERLVTFAERVIELAGTHLEDLKSYGITQEKIDTIRQRAAAFRDASSAPRAGTVDTSALTELLRIEVREASQLLRRFFDPMMQPFEHSHPEFFLTYKKARRLVQPASSSSRNGATALDAENAEAASTPEDQPDTTPEASPAEVAEAFAADDDSGPAPTEADTETNRVQSGNGASLAG